VAEHDRAWWQDYAADLGLALAALAMCVLRVVGILEWPWWLVLSPLLLVLFAWIGTYAALVVRHHRRRT
jgi:hypothetical protein